MKTKKEIQAERRQEYYRDVNFVYGYEKRNGQKRPTVTVAIVARLEMDGIYFGIGTAFCSLLDQVVKAHGRTKATARAKAVMDMHGATILSRPDAAENGYQYAMGLRVALEPREEFDVMLDPLGLSPSVMVKIVTCCKYLARKFE